LYGALTFTEVETIASIDDLGKANDALDVRAELEKPRED
jgi:hypothetical protein